MSLFVICSLPSRHRQQCLFEVTPFVDDTALILPSVARNFKNDTLGRTVHRADNQFEEAITLSFLGG